MKKELQKTEGSIWISWETHFRNRSLSRAFQSRLYEFDFSTNTKIVRYLWSIILTCFLIARKRNYIIFVQNPSILLNILAVMLKLIFKYKLVVDAHNALFRSYLVSSNFLLKIASRLCIKYSDILIVTNEPTAKIVAANNGRAVILNDILPEIEEIPLDGYRKGVRKITLICSYAPDEPVDEVLEAFRLLSCNYKFEFFVTGKIKNSNLPVSYKDLPIVFTDFLPRDEYEKLLLSSDLLIDLTYDQDTIVYGACEAITCGVPILLSDSVINRKIFPKGIVFVLNEAQSIEKAIIHSLDHLPSLRQEILEMRSIYREKWEQQFLNVNSEIFNYC